MSDTVLGLKLKISWRNHHCFLNWAGSLTLYSTSPVLLPPQEPLCCSHSLVWTVQLFHPECLCPYHCTPLSFWPDGCFSCLQPHADPALTIASPTLVSHFPPLPQFFLPFYVIILDIPGKDLTPLSWFLGLSTLRPGPTPNTFIRSFNKSVLCTYFVPDMF